MNAEQSARYPRIYDLVAEFDEPNAVFALAEAIHLIERAWAEKEEHFVRFALVEVIIALVHRQQFPDVAQALVSQMLTLGPDRTSLKVAARVAEWRGDRVLAAKLNAEAISAPDLLPIDKQRKPSP